MGILESLLKEGKLTTEQVEQLKAELLKEAQAELEKLRKENERLQTEVAQAREQLAKEKEELQRLLEEAKKAGNEELQKRYEAELAEKEKRLAEMSNALKQLKVKATLGEALDRFNPVDKEVVMQALQSSVQVTDQGAVVWSDGRALDEALKEFFEKRPHLVKAQGAPGSGSGQIKSGAVPTPKRRSEMTSAEKAKFIKEHGREAYFKLPE